MNERERYIETMLFGKPDRIPFSPGGPRRSTLERWRQEGLESEAHWHGALMKELGIAQEDSGPRVHPGVNLRMNPMFEEKIIEHRGNQILIQDWMGNIIEILDHFDPTYIRNAIDFVTRKWHKFPVETPADFDEMRKRYNPADPSRYPADWEERKRALAERDYPVTVAFPGPFWQLREWCGFEPLCVKFAMEPDFVKEMIAFWEGFVLETLERLLEARGVDRIFIQEDMAYKAHPMISPAMTREFLAPVYTRWVRHFREAEVPVVEMDSDGNVDLLIPIWIDCDIHACSPVEVAAGCDIVAYRERYGKEMAFAGGIDKRCIAKGGAVIEAELRRIEPVVRDGGYIPSCDHGVPPDISWPDFIHYSRLLAEMTGWF
ncbi:MAG: uroporphyrinogen decarboxylase family protein [Candidatus Sumerlaeia bacterium]